MRVRSPGRVRRWRGIAGWFAAIARERGLRGCVALLIAASYAASSFAPCRASAPGAQPPSARPAYTAPEQVGAQGARDHWHPGADHRARASRGSSQPTGGGELVLLAKCPCACGHGPSAAGVMLAPGYALIPTAYDRIEAAARPLPFHAIPALSARALRAPDHVPLSLHV